MGPRAYPDALREQEDRLLGHRGRSEEQRATDLGVAVSGGGIRSATFALGVFQAWAKKKQLARVAYMSTVSGGGYFGAFLGRLFSREYVNSVEDVEWILNCGPGGPPPSEKRSPEQRRDLENAGRNVLSWLRENGRYLSPRGSGDVLIFGAALLRNWISIQVVLGLLAFVVFLLLQAPRFLPAEGWLAGVAATFHASTIFEVRGVWLSVSPWVGLSGMVVVLAIPVIWAYWLAWHRVWWHGVVPVVVALALGGIAYRDPSLLSVSGDDSALRAAFVAAGAAALGTGLVWGAGLIRVLAHLRGTDTASRSGQRRLLRNRLAGDLKNILMASAVVATLGLVDTLGQTIYAVTTEGQLWPWLASLWGVLLAIGAFARQIVVLFGGDTKSQSKGTFTALAAYVGGLLVLLALAVVYDLLAHGATWNFQDSHPNVSPAPQQISVSTYFMWIGSAVAFLLAFGRSVPFVNQSTHHPLYSARLTRAYLGASNPGRWSGKSVAVIEPLSDDDVGGVDYWTWKSEFYAKGAPLHLVNVTVNETFDGESQVQQQDRKGLALAMGPAGISVGKKHHTIFSPEEPVTHQGGRFPRMLAVDGSAGFQVFDYDVERLRSEEKEAKSTSVRFPGEPMSLGEWVAVSGAAFSTGLGSRTNLGMSLLTGLFNIRLGRWWDSGISMKKRRASATSGRMLTAACGGAFGAVLPLYYYLMSELVARFPGVARQHWYLSDGGHFENMGAYELIRRRLRTIVIIDGEQDETSTMTGLANLVRKARIDFGTEIEFGDSLKALRPQAALGDDSLTYSTEHWAEARITYPEDESSLPRSGRLFYLKASLTGDEDADVLEYARRHPPFPHQTTGDQFFDEEQWESYRRLGFHIGDTAGGDLGLDADGRP